MRLFESPAHARGARLQESIAISPRRIRAALFAAVLLVCGQVAAAENTPAYDVEFTGVEESGLRESLREASQLVALATRPPATRRALQRRADEDLERLRTLLRSRGFYDPKVEYTIAPGEGERLRITINVATGPAYLLSGYAIRSTTAGAPGRDIRIDLAKLGLALGEVAEAAKIVNAEAKLRVELARRGYPLATIGTRRVVADHAKRTLRVDLPVALGPLAKFGKLTVTGLSDVELGTVLRQVAWRRGAIYDARLTDKTRADLRATGLFDKVIVRHGDAVGEDGEIPMQIELGERKHRSIGAGAAYSSTEGPSVKVFWEHRNLFSNGERLQLRAEGGLVTRGLFGEFRIPDVGRKDQALGFDASYTEEDQEAFESTATTATAKIERRFAQHYLGSVGLGIDRSTVDENGAERDFSLLVLPMSLRRDTKDNLLHPTTGGLDALTFTPHLGVLGTETNFYVAQYFDSVYLPLDDARKVIFAGWGRIGTILGEQTLDVPANRRLYSGGAGSVRGYALHGIGPLDAQGEPVGGRSLTEGGIELRWRVHDPFGVVAFVEGGGIYDDEIPSWGNDLQWGTGIGVRYHTAIGPIRLDFAVPLNRRNSVDDAFQILVSLGQAF